MAQIGWVEVATEDGTSGYLWYLKSESETRLRFDDYLEMAMVEGELAAAGSGSLLLNQLTYQDLQLLVVCCCSWYSRFILKLFKQEVTYCLDSRWILVLSDFDQVLKNLDTQGAIEENMLFLNRDLDLDFDDMLGQISAGHLVVLLTVYLKTLRIWLLI